MSDKLAGFRATTTKDAPEMFTPNLPEHLKALVENVDAVITAPTEKERAEALIKLVSRINDKTEIELVIWSVFVDIIAIKHTSTDEQYLLNIQEIKRQVNEMFDKSEGKK